MARTTERDALPTWSAHTLVMTLLEGPDHFNGHCTCDGWSYRTDDWPTSGRGGPGTTSPSPADPAAIPSPASS